MRFVYANPSVGTGNNIFTVSCNDILQACGLVATATNTAYPFVSYFRIKSMQMWGTTFGNAAFATVGVRWFNTVGFPTNVLESDTSLSQAFPAYVTSRPPRGSAASFWNEGSGQGLLELTYQECTSIAVDIHIDFKLSDQSTVTSPITTTNPMTVGQLYYPALDGSGSNAFRRQGLPPIN
jgi:hypothetical protein